MKAAGLFPTWIENLSVKEEVSPNELSSNQDNNRNGAQEDNVEDPSQPPAKLQTVLNQGGKGGQRLHMQRVRRNKRKHRLCPSIIQEWPEGCTLRLECPYKHDLQGFMDTKEPDLGDRCVSFETFGKCPSGVTCRFSRAHVGEDWKNLVNVDLWKQWEEKLALQNGLSEELCEKLQRGEFSLECSLQYISTLPKSFCAKEPGGQASAATTAVRTSGTVTDEDIVRPRPCEKRKLDLHGKLYLAPIARFGKIPFRRICKQYGADITCPHKTICSELLHQKAPWTWLKRHHTEDVFGIPLVGTSPTDLIRSAELFQQTLEFDFVDVCVHNPDVMFYNEDEGGEELDRTFRWQLEGMNYVLEVPLALTMSTSVYSRSLAAHRIMPSLRECGVSLVTLYGEQNTEECATGTRWDYMAECARIASPMPLFGAGSGDIFSFVDANLAMACGISGVVIEKAALIKPWIFTEIKEQRHWDISARERLDMLNDFVKYSLEYWGSDTYGVMITKQYLLEWLWYLCRYIPVGTLEHLPPKIDDKPCPYVYGDYLENLMASQEREDWNKISDMLLRV